MLKRSEKMCNICENCGQIYWCIGNHGEICPGREEGGLCGSCQERWDEASEQEEYESKHMPID